MPRAVQTSPGIRLLPASILYITYASTLQQRLAIRRRPLVDLNGVRPENCASKMRRQKENSTLVARSSPSRFYTCSDSIFSQPQPLSYEGDLFDLDARKPLKSYARQPSRKPCE